MKLDTWKVRQLIAEQNKTAAQVAVEAHLHPTGFYGILKRGTCSLRVGGRIALALGVSVTEIWIKE